MPSLPKTFRHNSKAQSLSLTDYTYDHGWKKLRDTRIKEEPLCRHCSERGHVTPAAQVDHIIPRADGGKDEWENTQSLCLPCHQAKTAQEVRRRLRGF